MMGNSGNARGICFPLSKKEPASLPYSSEAHFDALTTQFRTAFAATPSAAAVCAFVVANKVPILQWRALSLLGAKARANAVLAPAVKWLLEHRDALALFVGSGDVADDKFPEALQLLYHIASLHEGALEGVKLRIAVAVALTFSTPVLSFADGGPIDPIQRYASFCGWYEQGVLVPNFHRLTAWHLRYVVGSWARDEELAWAREHLPPGATVSTLGDAATEMVPYREFNDVGVSIHDGDLFYGGHPKTLAVLHQLGGVCGAVSKFSAAMCQAFGIPSMPVAQPGHCAHLWRHPDSDTWKLGNDGSGLSESTCHEGIQMTWGSTAWLIPMMDLAQQHVEAYIDSECLRIMVTFLSVKALRCDICAEARTVCQWNYLAWIACVNELEHADSEHKCAWIDAALTQLQADGAHPRDLALKKHGVTVSDCAKRAANLVDGTELEWWTGDSNAWIEIDLENVCRVNSVRIQWWGISVASKYTIFSAQEDSSDSCAFVPQKCHCHAKNPKEDEYNAWSEIPGWEAPTNRLRIEMSDGTLDPWGKGKLFGIRQIIVTGTITQVCRTPTSVLKSVAARDLSACPLASLHICAKIDGVAQS